MTILSWSSAAAFAVGLNNAIVAATRQPILAVCCTDCSRVLVLREGRHATGSHVVPIGARIPPRKLHDHYLFTISLVRRKDRRENGDRPRHNSPATNGEGGPSAELSSRYGCERLVLIS